MFVFELPEVGEGVVEAEVIDWKVAVGDTVHIDQPLCEITTDKAQLELSSPRAGTIVKLHGEPGDIIAVHAPLVEIDESGAAAAPAPEAKATPEPKTPAAPSKPAPKAAQPAAAPRSAPPARTGPTKAAPAVRRHAREANIDIAQVPGTGKGGRVTHDDLQAFQDGGAPQPYLPPALPQVRPSGSEERIKLIGIRRKIAEQMAQSKHTAAHFTYVEEIDVTRLVELRAQLKGYAKRRGIKLTYVPFFMKACSLAFREFPNINANMDEERFELVVKGDHNIGMAVDSPQGLFVPVVKNVEQKSVLHIAAEVEDLANRTREGKAKLDEFRGGTFTITSVGNIGGVLATPIINVPQVAILGVNMIRDRAVVVDGDIVVRKMVNFSPSFDHRIIDGAVGARFVRFLKDLIEQEPASLLMDDRL